MANENAFWEHFRREAPAWASLLYSGQGKVVFEGIDNLLELFRFPYCFDITHENSVCYFILSPEGNFVVATRIDELVMSAPSIPKWKVFARRQRKSLEDACAIVRNLYLVDPSTARFRLFERDGSQFIQMFVPPSADLETEEQIGLLYTFLWHAIGEATVMDEHIGAELFLAEPPLGATLSASELVKRF